MKIRMGFVTNSSSSSFLIKRTTEDSNTVDLDQAYMEIKSLYKNMKDKLNEVVELAVQWGIIEQGQGIEDVYDRAEKELYSGKETPMYKLFIKAFDAKFNFDIFDIDISRYDLGWMKCDTYTEYLAYFKEPNEMPFVIVDHHDFINDDTKRHNVEEAVVWYKYEEIFKCRGMSEEAYADKLKELALSMGDYGVYSECGQIPGIVVNELCELTKYSCNHMG